MGEEKKKRRVRGDRGRVERRRKRATGDAWNDGEKG